MIKPSSYIIVLFIKRQLIAQYLSEPLLVFSKLEVGDIAVITGFCFHVMQGSTQKYLYNNHTYVDVMSEYTIVTHTRTYEIIFFKDHM